MARGVRCRYCGRWFDAVYAATADHVFPRSRLHALVLPTDHEPLRNLTPACDPCNNDKSDMTLCEFLQALVSQRDPRAERVAGLIQTFAARGWLYLCGV